MKRNTALLLSSLLLGVVLLAGCSSTGSGKKGDGTDAAGNALSEQDLNAEQRARFAGGSIPTAEGEGIFRDVRFSLDSADVDDSGRQDVEYNAQLLQDNPDIKLQLEGHCDERGTAEYNMALGSRRARAVFDLLASYGINKSRIETISYGEEVPLDSRPVEEAWAKNRRVHFSASHNVATQ